MKTQEVILLPALGLAIWVLGTVYFANRGAALFESANLRYWISFAISPFVSAALCIFILRWRHVAASDWTFAMLLLAIPGMIGEAVVLSNLSTFMPKFHETSGGRYAAFLFATYALVLGIAEMVTMRAGR
jgi:Family of unknown function (DUF5367)